MCKTQLNHVIKNNDFATQEFGSFIGHFLKKLFCYALSHIVFWIDFCTHIYFHIWHFFY